MLGISLSLWSSTAISSGTVTVTAFDPSVSDANLVFTNNNLTASNIGSEVIECAQIAHAKGRTVTSGGSNAYEFTITVNAIDDAGQIGLVDTSVSMSADGTQISGVNNSICWASNGLVFVSGGYPGGVSTNIGSFGAGDVLKVRMVGSLVGFAKNGTWLNGFNSTTGSGGFDVSTTALGSSGITTAVPTVELRNLQITGDFSGW